MPNEKVTKIGTLLSDFELRVSDAGKYFARSRLAYKPYRPQGSPPAETQYYDLVAFGSLAEHASTSLQKGDRVICFGEGSTDHWTDRLGGERTGKKITLEGIGPDLRFSGAAIERASKDDSAYLTLDSDGEPF